jgi:hypothetical protein
MKKYTYILAVITIVGLASCEDAITVDNGFEASQIVVDAWITNEAGPQMIEVTESQDYFDNRLPTVITNAQVTITNGSQVFDFIHISDGKYTWTPTTGGEVLGNIGDEFTLKIEVDNKTLTSTTQLNRVPEIDSISIFFEGDAFGADDGYFAELYATDHPGKGDTYWVKSYRNDTLLNRPQELNIIYDATFDAGTDIDGTTFIRPLRFAINAIDEDGLPRNLKQGDKVKCEIYSISNDAFRFLQLVQEQTTNGDNSIFALPVANSRGNIRDENGDLILGVFNIAAVSREEVEFE